MKILVVTPAWNEESSIQSVIEDVRNSGYDHLVIDDGSSDSTSEFAKFAGAMVVTLPVNLGVGGALKCGFRFARERGYDAVVQVDGDGQHLASEISRLVGHYRQTGDDLVIGSRFAANTSEFSVPILRRLPMLILSRFASHWAKRRLTDVTSGFRLIGTELLSEFSYEFPSYFLGDTFEATVQAARKGFSVSETSVVMRPRQQGLSSSSIGNSIGMILKALVLAILSSRSVRSGQP